MAPLLNSTCAELKCSLDARQLEALRARVAAKVQELEAKVQDAEEKDGETEVRDALIALADYIASTGDREAAYQAYERAERKTAGAGLKMDQVFRKIRLDILWGNWLSVKDNLATAEKLCESGGDWERKNRLKVYRAVHAMATRDFKTAADLLLGAVATFTTTELFSYEQCIFYAVITSSVALDRVSIKKRVVDSPEILTVIHRLPSVESLINSLHSCNYHEFLQAFVGVLKQLSRDMYLAPHLKYFTREMRVVVYSQYLESYKSVTLQSMASAFGVSEEFVDTEISNFIVEGRISAKIDKVSGIIETSRLDAKNTLYQQTLRQGDLLLNRIQKLSKIIDVE